MRGAASGSPRSLCRSPRQTLTAQIQNHLGYAGAEAVDFTRPLSWMSVRVAAQRSLVEVVPGQVAVTAITGPDGRTVHYGYGTGVHAKRLQQRTNQRGQTTTFGFDGASRFASHTVAGLVPVTHAPAESRGVPGGPVPAAQPLDSLFTRIDGPRSDVADVTTIWVNRHGAPVRVRDPLGAETRLTYDAVWPGLVRESVGPTGLRTRAWLSAARGLPDSVTAYGLAGAHGAVGAPANPTTRYSWHASADLPTQVVAPNGTEITTYGWDLATRNMLWQRTGAAGRQVNYAYDPVSKLLTSVTPPMQGASTLTYDALGNVATHQTPLGRMTTTVRDAIGRVIRETAPDGIVTRTWYDVMDRADSTHTIGPARTVAGVPGGVAPADSVAVRYLYNETGHPIDVLRRYRHGGMTYTPQARWGYDAADRVVWHLPEGSGREDYGLDPAGHVVWTRTTDGDTLRQRYDAAGRLVERRTPGRTFGPSPCSAYDFTQDLAYTCFYSFPTLASMGASVVLPADTARFAYDAAGQLTRAYNTYARVRRSYTPGGQLATDTLHVRTYTGNDILGGWGSGGSGHLYGLRSTYDGLGRRVALEYPASLRPAGHTRTTVGAGYDPTTGELTSVTDLHGRAFQLDYDSAGRHWRTVFPQTSGASETRTFDGDGRVATYAAPGAANDVYTRDAAGRITGVTLGVENSTVQLRYNGLGGVVRAEGSLVSTNGVGVIELFALDAIGNRVWQRALGARPLGPDADEPRQRSYDGLGRLQAVDYDATGQGCAPHCGMPYKARHHYDAGGKRLADWSYEQVGGMLRLEQARYYYDAGGRLRLTNRHVGPGGAISGEGGVYEEYRYDALGRRVLVRSRSTGPCGTPCEASYLERTVWDGAQVVAEVRAPGGDERPEHSWESDAPFHPTLSGGGTYGRVTYVHGLGIDAPLAVIREGLGGGASMATVFPHGNWRGEYVNGSVPGQTVPHSQCLGVPACPPLTWPGARLTLDGAPPAGAPASVSWWGSLLRRQADGSGLQYLRNRYYDAKTGTFTQVDPIGLAGGLNLYGFAGGDPVNYSDPFGLCSVPTAIANVALGAAISRATGSSYGIGAAAFDVATGCIGLGALKNAARLARLARAADKVDEAAEAGADAAGPVKRIFSARVLKRMADEPGPFHNFPEAIGQEVLAKGKRTVVSSNYATHTMRGAANGVEGTYEIGVRPSASGRNEVITHWFFRPDKK